MLYIFKKNPLAGGALLAAMLLTALGAALLAWRLSRSAGTVTGVDRAGSPTGSRRRSVGDARGSPKRSESRTEEESEQLQSWPAPRRESYVCDGHLVTVAVMPEGEDSLYFAVAHQLHGPPVGSPRHREIAVWLRTAAKIQLQLNPEDYEELMLDSVDLLGERYSGLLNKAARLRAYLLDVNEPGFPLGLEELYVLADTARADLMLYPEGGRIHLVPSGASQVFWSARLGQRASPCGGGQRRHYDSVVGVRRLEPCQEKTQPALEVKTARRAMPIVYRESALTQQAVNSREPNLHLRASDHF
ncbi:uncharacterized protein LOC134540172 isoform X2 [Bacillus rossius redtenbacheri]|uniref:uncharacterized protein LOC134540172 isoform X2 n=1 Tax=Bacillus rossius redtenbacheri TaxID=93214 RepID=UPI002FDEA7F4